MDWGILLTQIGSPESLTTKAVRRFLKHFLSDPRVMDYPAWKWYPVLYGIILPFRSPQSFKRYKLIWTKEGSPATVFTQKLREKLENYINQQGVSAKVIVGNYYTSPFVQEALYRLFKEKPKKLIILPLFPQFATSTTGSALDLVAKALKGIPYCPPFTFITHYYDHPAYKEAWVKYLQAHEEPLQGFILFSFHGQPIRFIQKGDPYPHHCEATAELIAKGLALPSDGWKLVYQSQFGKEPWLKPSLRETLKILPSQGVQEVAVVCPGFSIDGLETLEEVALEGKNLFLNAGGQTFHFIPCLNDSSLHVEMLYRIICSYVC